MVDVVFAGSTCQALAKEVADESQAELGALAIKRFPDGELYLRVESDVKGKSCAVLQSTCRPQDSNIVELLILLENLKELGAEKVVTVVPYYGYSRQDQVFREGEAVSARVFAKHVSMHSDEFYTINIHEKNILKYFDIPAHDLDADKTLGEYFKTYEFEDPVVIGPDEGAEGLAMGIAKVLECDPDCLQKMRIRPGEVEMKPKSLDVEGKDVFLVDDMIDSGGTMAEAIRMLLSQNARNVLVGSVHPVLTGNVVSRLFSAGAVDVVATNTIPTDISFITVSGIIASALV
ncbi:MAG: ribose-phosphate diphosphokinase [Candidatus Hydrothermarchaeales archaeon]